MKDPNWRKCILRADSREVIKRIPDNSIDFILTDPPYNLGQHSTGNIPLAGRTAMNNDIAEWDMVDFIPEAWADDFVRILKPTGNLFIFTSYNQLGRWHKCLDHRFDTTNFMIWHKTNPAPKIFRAGFLNSCEIIFTCWNKRHTWNFISQEEMHNFIESPVCMKPERLSNPKHPTQKPVSILKKMIEIASNEDDIVFDPFMGVGSSGVAALELNRRFIGIELDKSYFEAAKNRIETTMSHHILPYQYTTYPETQSQEEADGVCEPLGMTASPIHKLNTFLTITENDRPALKPRKNAETGMQPIIKWPGGKEKELKYILPNMPHFERFIEPFVGGGSVFMGIEAERFLINDISSELTELYHCIQRSDPAFFEYARKMDTSWSEASAFFKSHPELAETYVKYRNGHIDTEGLRAYIHLFCDSNRQSISGMIGEVFSTLPCVLHEEMETNLFRKMVRMHKLEMEKHPLADDDLSANIETAIKSAVYMNYRYLYNDDEIADVNPKLHCALFFFMRNYSYSGMFRYSSKGEFNVPYGGMAYNSKMLDKKLNYYRSKDLLRHFDKTVIYNLDFAQFLRKVQPGEDDFIFLDPPYDSEFSTYAQNAFTREDHRRLADYLINECRAKWMLIIKNTDFIYGLYSQQHVRIRSFSKEYMVSFMNRNERKVTHLMITNY